MSARNLCFTLNNYTDEEYENVCNMDCTYIVVGKEVGENGTPHLQGYVEFAGSKRFTTLRRINPRIHWEARRGKAAQAADYCKKDNNFIERGTISKQGVRSDLTEMKDKIINGNTTVENIAVEYPMLYHQYGRTLSKIEDIALRKKFRTEMTTCEWIYGPTGVGKSHRAYEGFTPETHYIYPNDNGWWDGYTGQQIVIINEFRGQILYSELLDLIDKWPKTVKRRNREPVPFLAKHIIITSSLAPHEAYRNLSQNDDLAQLLRRIVLTHMVENPLVA